MNRTHTLSDEIGQQKGRLFSGLFRTHCPLLESRDTNLVEVAGVEPASEDIQRNGPTCVVNVLRFVVAHAH